jgi:hypothetical protein
MKKYLTNVDAPNPYTWGTDAHKAFTQQIEMRIVVSEDGRVLTRQEMAYTSVGRTHRSTKREWKEVSLGRRTVAGFLIQVGAAEGNFRGAPHGIL